MSENISACGAIELRNRLLQGEFTPEEVIDEVLGQIDRVDKKLHSFLYVDREGAHARAKELQKKLAQGKSPGALFGIPIAIKNNICVQGWNTNAGSKILENFISPYHATVIEKILQADGILIGATNCDEFAMGSSCENSAFGPTRNPWDLTRVPGGSSGGSAAAVAAGLVPLALGSDTGGSIRQPAALTGTVGFKPRYGAVSRFGLIAFASSLDQIGPFARSVHDARLLYETILGPDVHDATCSAASYNSQKKVKGVYSLQGLRLGMPVEYWNEKGIDPEVRTHTQQAIEHFCQQFGTQKVEISLPHTDYAIATYYLLATAEASSNLARYDGMRYGKSARNGSLLEMYEQTREHYFGEEVKRRILLGTYCLSSGYYDAYYNKALQIKSLLSRDFAQAFAKCDLLITPTSPFPAFPLGEKLTDPLAMYLCDIFTATVNLTGHAAMSLPVGFSARGLPIGLQLICNSFSENQLFSLAMNFQKTTDFHLRRPKVLEN